MALEGKAAVEHEEEEQEEEEEEEQEQKAPPMAAVVDIPPTPSAGEGFPEPGSRGPVPPGAICDGGGTWEGSSGGLEWANWWVIGWAWERRGVWPKGWGICWKAKGWIGWV